ncbi:MAG TPA: amidohydrolase family protein [Pyrinomonadaceae bacterium]|nr:amidohydrolase family protein [Pyrinomonadaceae bacterium]
MSHSKANLAFTGGYWFDGKGFAGQPARNHTFYSIAGILTSKKPARVDSVIDLKTWFIVPPFGEAHNHNADFSSEEQWARIREMYLRDGIFYVKNPANLPRAAAPLAGRINIPASIDVVFAHGLLTATDGHPLGLVKRNVDRGGMLPSDADGGFCWIIDSLADLDSKWPRIVAGKPDFIKNILVYSEEYEKRRDDKKYFTWKGLNPALLPDIVRRAHRAGLRVSTHVESASDFHSALIAGSDEINHLPGFRPENDDIANGYQDLARYRISEEDARLSARKKAVVVTTVGRTIELTFNSAGGLKSPEGVREMLTHNLQILKKHGVPIAIGSDSFRQTSQPEALSLSRLGALDNLTLLKMWTETTAWTIFPRRKIGRLKDGYEASFLALSGDPIKDFTNVQRIEMKVKQGMVI